MSLITAKPFTFDRVIRIAILIGIAWALISLVGYLSDVLIPFAVALLLAYLLNPLVGFIQVRLRVRIRPIAVVISLVLVAGVLTAFFWLLVPKIAAEIRHMGRLLSNLVNETDMKSRASALLSEELWQFLKDFAAREDVQAFFSSDKFGDLAAGAAKKILPGVWGLFSGALNLVLATLGLAIIMLYLVFILIDYEKIAKDWVELIPLRARAGTVRVLNDFKDAMQNYFRAQSLIAFIVGVLFAIGFWIIGLPLAIVLGLLIGLLNMVPYLQMIGLVPAVFFALMRSLETGESFWLLLAMVLAVFAAVQLIQEVILNPRILGNAMGLNPAVILLSVSIWGKLLGFVGVIIALPMTFLLLCYYRQFLAGLPGEPTATEIQQAST